MPLQLFLLFSFLPIYAIDYNIHFNKENVLSFTYELYDINKNELLEILESNHQSEIFIQYRLYQRKKKPYSFFGDNLIEFEERAIRAHKDIISKSYKIIIGKKTKSFEDKNLFLSSLFNDTIELKSQRNQLRNFREYYLKVKIIFTEKVLTKPFNIIYLADLFSLNSSGWLHLNLELDNL